MFNDDGCGNFETLFFAPLGNPLLPQAVKVTVRCAYNRTEEPSVDRVAIEETWESFSNGECMNNTKNGILYNGLKFRLHDIVQEGDICHLKMGITDYKTSIGTTRNIERYIRFAEAQSVTLENYLSNAFGVECFTVTSDWKGVLFCRSWLVSEYAGYFCFPGGHPEPRELLDVQRLESTHPNDVTHISLTKSTASWFEYVNSTSLVRLLFESAVTEVVDELGVDPSLCWNKGLISIIKNAHSRKPDACFWIELKQSSQEVKACFDSRNGADAFESVLGSLLFIDLNQICDKDSALHFVAEELQGKLTQPSLACLLHGIQCLQRRRCCKYEEQK